MPCHRNSFETEFDMSLTDWSSEAIITPRAMSSLFTGSEFLSFTQRSHRGTSTLTYRWGSQDDRKVGNGCLIFVITNTLCFRCGSQVVQPT